MDKPGLLQSTSTLSFLTQRQDGNQGSYLPPVIAPPGGGGGGGTPSLSVSVTPSAAEGGTHTITVTLSAASATAVTFDLALSGSGGNPVNAADFGGAFPSWAGVSIAAGQLTATRTFAATNDSDVEPDETGVVTLSNASGATIAVATAGFSVLNNDSAGSLMNTRLPQLSGAAYGGQTLAYGRGGYSAGFSSRSHKYQYADTGAGPWTDVPDGAGDFLFLPVGTYTGKVISVLETVSDGTTTLNIRSAVSPAVQAMAMAIPAAVSNPMMAVLGASFEGGIVRGASVDRYGWWVRPAMFGKFLMGNRRIRHNYSGTGIVPAQPYVLASDGDSAQQVAAQATTLAADSAYAAESAHFIWFNPGSNTLSASASGGTSWLTYAGNGLAALRAAYPNAQILIPEQMMRGTAGSEWIAGGFGRANVYQVNAALGALASTYGAIVVPWFARSGNPNDALEGRAYDWAVQDDFVHPAMGRGWEMSRGFAAAAKPYVADLGADASGTQVMTSVGAGSGGTLTNATGAVWANWTLEGVAGQQVVGAVAGDKLTITATALVDQAASGAFAKLRRSTGQFYATTANVAYRVRMKGRIRSSSPSGINAYLRAELSDNNASLSASLSAGALYPGNQSGAYTLSTTTSGAALISDDWQEFSLESSSFNRAAAVNVTPVFVVESRVAAGGILAGQQIEIEFDEITVVSL